MGGVREIGWHARSVWQFDFGIGRAKCQTHRIQTYVVADVILIVRSCDVVQVCYLQRKWGTVRTNDKAWQFPK